MPDSWAGLHQLKKYKFTGNRINTSEDTWKKNPSEDFTLPTSAFWVSLMQV